MHLRLLALSMAMATLASAPAAAQRWSRPVGDRSAIDTTVAFETGDVVHVTSYPAMASGVQVCGSVGPGLHWGKMLYARTDAEASSAQQSIVSFPSSSATPLCEVHRPQGGDSLFVVFERPVRDNAGRVGRITVGGMTLPLAPLLGRRVTFAWVREGPFDIPGTQPPPDTVGPPRP